MCISHTLQDVGMPQAVLDVRPGHTSHLSTHTLQEADVLQVILDWTACCPARRAEDMAQLLSAVRTQEL